MAHGNKTMPLDRYPYMDNNLKSRESRYVTHEELKTVVNNLNTTIEDRAESLTEQINANAGHIEEIGDKLIVKTKEIELTDMGDFELTSSKYSEFGNVVFISMEVKLLSDLDIDKNKFIGAIDYQSGYKKPLGITGWSGISTTGQLLKNSGRLEIKNITNDILMTGTKLTFSLAYIGEDVK